MNQPKLNWSPELAEKYKQRYGTYPSGFKSETPKLSDKEEAMMRIATQSFGNLPLQGTYPGSSVATTDSLTTGLKLNQSQAERLKIAQAKEQRDVSKYRVDYKKSLLDLEKAKKEKEPDYQKQIEETQKKIADIETGKAEVAPAYKEVSPGKFVKEKYQADEYSEAQDLYKSKQSLRQGNQTTLDKEKYKKQLEQLQRNKRIQEFAVQSDIPTKELVTKFDKFENLAKDVYGNQDKYVSGLVKDPNKRNQILKEVLNQLAVKELGMDIEDVENILGIKVNGNPY